MFFGLEALKNSFEDLTNTSRWWLANGSSLPSPITATETLRVGAASGSFMPRSAELEQHSDVETTS